MYFNIGQRLVLATHNQGKVREIGAMLRPHRLTVIDASSASVPEPIEDGDSFEANALLKSRHAARVSGLPALADDSGLAVTALDGAPGIYSARYGGPGQPFSKAIERVLAELSDHTDRSARFISVLALTYESGGREYSHCFGGSVLGSITHHPIGEHGFGYDPIFIPQHHRLSFAQMPQETKNTISHRARSFQLFRHAMLP